MKNHENKRSLCISELLKVIRFQNIRVKAAKVQSVLTMRIYNKSESNLGIILFEILKRK